MLVTMITSLSFSSCTEDDGDEQCQVVDVKCDDRVTVIDKATTCCTADECYFEYDGVTYDTEDKLADGVYEKNPDVCPVSSSTMELKSDMSHEEAVKAYIKEQMKEVTQKLLAEARACSGC